MMTIEDNLEDKILLDKIAQGAVGGDVAGFNGNEINFEKIRGNGSVAVAGVNQQQGGSVMHRALNPVQSDSQKYREGWKIANWSERNESTKFAYARWIAKKRGMDNVVLLIDDIVNAKAAGEKMGLLRMVGDFLSRSTFNFNSNRDNRNKPQPGGSPMGNNK